MSHPVQQLPQQSPQQLSGQQQSGSQQFFLLRLLNSPRELPRIELPGGRHAVRQEHDPHPHDEHVT
ncbi:MAG: hypothetical protein MKZ95_09315 [Pirellulales bacterium]|nr:hypothetical protein [Pirellulales bacterium]